MNTALKPIANLWSTHLGKPKPKRVDWSGKVRRLMKKHPELEIRLELWDKNEYGNQDEDDNGNGYRYNNENELQIYYSEKLSVELMFETKINLRSIVNVCKVVELNDNSLNV